MKILYKAFKLIIFLFVFTNSLVLNAQNKVTHFDSSSQSIATKYIDLSKLIGETAGAIGTTQTGGVGYTIPIFASPGTNGMQPSVALVYNSQSSDGVAGIGWNLSGLSVISRTGKNMYHNGNVQPVSFTADDAFLKDGTRLNPINGANGANGTVYALETENFSQIISNTSSDPNNPNSFTITNNEGTTMEFGNSSNSKLLTDDGVNTMLWRINKIKDVNGNYIEFSYEIIGRESRISQISYTGNSNTGLLPYNTISFFYVNRNDPNTSFDAGSSITSSSLLYHIVVGHTNDQGVSSAVRSYIMNFDFGNNHTKLTEITEYGGDETSPSLNSTVFTYGTPTPNNFGISTQNLNSYSDFVSGDFDGDGKTDVAANEKYFDNDLHTFINTAFYMYSNVDAPTSMTLMYLKSFSQQTTLNNIKDAKFYNLLAGDYDGDGRDDILQVNSFTNKYFICNPANNGVATYAYRRNINSVTLNYTKSFNSNTGFTDHIEQNFPYPTVYGTEYRFIHENGNFIIPGDFTGDGNQDYILITGKRRFLHNCYLPGVGFPIPNFVYDYKAFLTSPSTGLINEEITNFGIGANPYGTGFYSGTVAEADKISIIDFDGDGKMEVVLTKNQLTYILAIDGISPTTGYNFTATLLHITGAITKDSKYFSGDFNGDKKTDILVKISNNASWNILYSTGKIFNSIPFNFNQTVQLTGNYADNKIIIGDFDGDGKTDILHGYNVFVNNVSNSAKLSVYYSKGSATSYSFYYEQYSYPKTLAFTDLIQGDFNGDGRCDLANLNGTSGNGYTDYIYIKPFGQDKLITNITTGHNVSTDFEYKLLTDKATYPYFYDRTISLDDISNSNPFNYVQIPMYAIYKTTSEDGLGGNNTTVFSYENAILHRTAKGFLGFEKVTSKNNVTGVTTISENLINRQFAIPYSSKETKKLTISTTLISENFFTNSFINLSTGSNDKRFLSHLDGTVSYDYINDKAVQTTNSYDNFGNVTNNTTVTGYKNGSTITQVEVATTATTFGIHNSNVPAKPESITITNTRIGNPIVSKTKTINYDNLGRAVSEVDFSGLPKALTTSIAYNAFGNIVSSSKAVSGVPSIISTTSYDIKGRFPIQKQVTGGINLQSESVLFDSKWGMQISSTSSDCLTTLYEYDAFGRLINTILPDGNSISRTNTWQVNGNKLFYLTEHSSGGSPDRKKYFDKWGKVWKEEKAGMVSTNQWHTILSTFDNRGNIQTKTNSYFPGIETPRITTNTFDIYNRPFSISDYKGDIYIGYTNLGSGNMNMTILGTDGNSTSKITDACGKIISTTDNGGTLTFEYDSQGNQIEVKNNGIVMSNSVYDLYGMQTSMADIDAGTTTYSYDNFNRLSSQTDAKGNSYQIIYDDLGRTLTRTGAEGTTTYEYYSDVATGCSNNNLKKVIGFNGITREYAYDALKRVISVLETGVISGNTASRLTSYTYNTNSVLASTTYPSGVSIYNFYDNNGYLIKKSLNATGNIRGLLYYNPQMDGEGKITSYTLGNGKITTKTYDGDFPASTSTTGVQNLTYNFQPSSGNLLQRNDILKNQVENFTYDNLNRLNGSTVINGLTIVNQLAIRYDGSNNSSMGNIDSKTDAGYYTYLNNKKHAVAFITPNPVSGQQSASITPVSVISHDEQLIQYTPFLKPQSISEASNLYGGGIYLQLEYGPDYERITSAKGIGRNLQTRYYAGDYEEQQLSNSSPIQNIHYVSGEDGLCAIIVKENEIITPYFTYTDYLGSILTVTDNFGNIVASKNFDAWGRERDPNAWNNFITATQTPTWLYRGFTGHEMLPEFGLVNMNARLYDPITGRMCSPDNYVANTNGTQGYNRYSYANNNPLVYTDPDGNFVLAVIAIFTAVHVTADLIRNDFKINFGQYLGSFFRGALSGFLASTGAGAITSASSAFVAAAASELPGVSIPISDHFSLGLSPAIAYGSGGWSYGGSLSLNAHFNNIDIGFGLGAEYGKSSTTGIQGWSSRTSMMSGIRFGDVSVGVGSSSFKSGITSQTTGMAYAGVGDFRIRYENDYMWKGSPVGDGGDRYRTTAATISYKDYSLGLNLFTGDPGLQNRKVEGENDKTGFKGTYIEKNQQFRLGAFYAGVGNYRFGVNGEPVRNFFQNHLAHKDGFAFPLFKVLSTVIKPYGTYQTRNSYTSW